MSTDQVNFFLNVLATIAFASTGVLAATQKRVDFISAIILGVITAVGGGTIRDLILDVPVFWSKDLYYVRVAILSSVITFVAITYFTKPLLYKLILYIDGFGAAMVGMLGAYKAIELDFAWPLGPLILGVITAIGGGAIRDVVSNRPTLLMTDDIYAEPVIVGCIGMLALMHFFPHMESEAIIIGMLIAFLFRSAAIYWNLKFPDWFSRQQR